MEDKVGKTCNAEKSSNASIARRYRVGELNDAVEFEREYALVRVVKYEESDGDFCLSVCAESQLFNVPRS
jgi:hypothetical protein